MILTLPATITCYARSGEGSLSESSHIDSDSRFAVKYWDPICVVPKLFRDLIGIVPKILRDPISLLSMIYHITWVPTWIRQKV